MPVSHFGRRRGGCWAAAGSEKALSGSGQAGAARISRVVTRQPGGIAGKAGDRNVCAGVGAEGCHGLFRRKAAVLNYDLSGKQTGKWTE